MSYRENASHDMALSPKEMGKVRSILGRNIRRLRKLRNYTLEDLSDMAGIHGTFLGHIELGTKALSIYTLVCIARALAVLPTVLLRGIR